MNSTAYFCKLVNDANFKFGITVIQVTLVKLECINDKAVTGVPPLNWTNCGHLCLNRLGRTTKIQNK